MNKPDRHTAYLLMAAHAREAVVKMTRCGVDPKVPIIRELERIAESFELAAEGLATSPASPPVAIPAACPDCLGVGSDNAGVPCLACAPAPEAA